MGSVAAMKKGLEISSEDEFHGKSYKNDTLIAEGVEGLVPCSGTVQDLVTQLLGGMMRVHSMNRRANGVQFGLQSEGK